MFVGPLQENILLTAPDLSGSTYAWSVPADATITEGQGNDSLYFTWGENPGIVSLVITNECGTDSITHKMRFYGQYAYPDPDLPHPIPGIINATDYDYGGEGIAYHDTETANQGAGPREEEGVDTEFSDNGIANVGWISAGEWLEYSIQVYEDEYYDAALRVASNNATRGPLQMLINGEERIAGIDLPSTGSWSTFTTVIVHDIPFYTTDTLMRILAGTGGFNLGNMTFDSDIPDAVKEIPQRSLSVYPNPASGKVSIRSDHMVQQVIVRDMTGKTLKVAGPFPNTENAELPVSGFRPGLYFLHVLFDDASEETVKIVLW